MNTSDDSTNLKEIIINIRNEMDSGLMYDELCKKIDLSTHEKRERIINWSENEKKNTELAYKTDLEGIENEFKEKIRISIERRYKLLRYKYDLLLNATPETAEYFSFFNLPIMQKIEMIKPEVNSNDLVDIPDLDRPQILEPNDVINDLSFINQKNKFKINGKTLIQENIKFKIGNNITLNFKNNVSIKGTINGIANDSIHIAPYDSKDFYVNIRALNAGIVNISLIEN